ARHRPDRLLPLRFEESVFSLTFRDNHRHTTTAMVTNRSTETGRPKTEPGPTRRPEMALNTEIASSVSVPRTLRLVQRRWKAVAGALGRRALEPRALDVADVARSTPAKVISLQRKRGY